MANDVPSNPVGADVGFLLSGESLNQGAVSPFGQAHNYILARAGTGTPRIAQIFPRRGTSSPSDPVFSTSSAAASANCFWWVPGTLGATSLRCYVFGSSIGGAGTVVFKSVSAADATAPASLPSTPGLVDCGLLTIDSADEVVELWVDGSGGHTATIDAVNCTIPVASSPLAAAPDAADRVPMDADELDTPEALCSIQGKRMRDALVTTREAPHVYANWSGIDGISPASAKYMRSVPHAVPCLVWADTSANGWTVTVRVHAKNGTGGDLVVNVGAVPGLGGGANGGIGAPRRLARITVPAATTAWFDETLTLPPASTIQYMPAGWLTATIVVWPEPKRSNATRTIANREGGTQVLSTAQIMSMCVEGK